MAKKKKLEEPIAIKDSLNDKGAKKLKEIAKEKSKNCPYCNIESPEIANEVYLCCGNKA